MQLCTCGKSSAQIVRSTRSKTTAALFTIVAVGSLVLLPFGDLTGDAVFPLILLVLAMAYMSIKTIGLAQKGHSLKCSLRQAYLLTTGSDELAEKS